MFLQTAVNNTEADTLVQAKYLSGRAYVLMGNANVDYRLANAMTTTLTPLHECIRSSYTSNPRV